MNAGFDFDKVVEIDRRLKTGKEDVIMNAAEQLIEKGIQIDDVVKFTELSKDQVSKLH
ncbi:hypothetical protein M1N64_03960 [Peptococcaceae bacterium]|nr:hypothetical protein [Peptococcaceae bacterium]